MIKAFTLIGIIAALVCTAMAAVIVFAHLKEVKRKKAYEDYKKSRKQ